jgi:flagellar hook assembly protein FlgD
VDDEFNELNIEISQSELVDAAIHYSEENRMLSICAKNMVGRDTLTLMVADGEDSTFHKLSIKVDAETGVKKGMFSAEYRLNQNYPNPFNPATTISFSLAENARVNLTVYNLRGQRIFSLISGEINAGRHEVIWKGRDFQGNAVPAGIYFYRLETENFTAMKKMLFIK